MQVPLTTILCMLGICVCIDIVFRVFNIHVSWWNGRFRPDQPEESPRHDTNTDTQPKAPPHP